MHLLVSIDQLLQAIWIQCPYWLTQIPIHFGIAQVNLLAFIIGQHPRKDRVLGDVIECSPCHQVQCHNVLKVADLPLAPKLGEFGLLEYNAGIEALE